MRSFISAVAVVLALLLTAVAVPAAWADVNVVKEDGFVHLASALGKDPEFQSRLATAAAGNFESSVNLPEPLKSVAADALREAASGMQSWPEYPKAWEETARNSHRLNFGGGKQPEETVSHTALLLDIGPLMRLIRDRLSSASGLQIEVPAESLVTMGEPSQKQLVDRVAAFAPLWWLAAVGAVVSVLLALAAARRRSLVMVSLGLGGLVLAALWSATVDLAGGLMGSLSSGNGVAELFKQEFFSAVRTGFAEWIVIAAVVSGAFLALGVIAWILSARRRSRSASGQGPGR
ncbi:hypothetical protein [Arthrobacter sp. StoSoilB13]|uniref:hypothetical protein n=1 Tax=Arthrobacter sp. StoSoilB13 TaxID=2830993 RepID=UPI001CC77C7F|nr:hypothetical protein [Arthrobacter sp. StoSoilB13]BCW49212.1 hypothetical protein StoSoilB13_15540 [Arthrobacter sp. StoSoilB13]